MIHSASFFATGSDIAAADWVSSAVLCLRTSSTTFSSASLSACEVDDVAATAAGGGGLRACSGGRAACWRVAGAMWGAAGIDIGAGAVVLAAVLAAGTLVLLEILGTTLRAIGRGFGNGTSGLAQASPADTDNATASVRLVANAVDRNAATREDGVTAFLRGESLNRSSPGSILIEYVDKTLNTPDAAAVCANTAAKSRLCLGASGPFPGSSDPI